MDSKSIGLCPQGFESPRCRFSSCLLLSLTGSFGHLEVFGQSPSLVNGCTLKTLVCFANTPKQWEWDVCRKAEGVYPVCSDSWRFPARPLLGTMHLHFVYPEPVHPNRVHLGSNRCSRGTQSVLWHMVLSSGDALNTFCNLSFLLVLTYIK